MCKNQVSWFLSLTSVKTLFVYCWRFVEKSYKKTQVYLTNLYKSLVHSFYLFSLLFMLFEMFISLHLDFFLYFQFFSSLFPLSYLYMIINCFKEQNFCKLILILNQHHSLHPRDFYFGPKFAYPIIVIQKYSWTLKIIKMNIKKCIISSMSQK